MGSAHSVNATEPEWIGQELALLRDAIAAEVPVLGLCWGGQALSVAAGGEVGPAAVPEVGWLYVQTQDPAIPAGPWLHYHYEMFTVPPGAVEVARSPAGPAAFRLGPHLGLQFHPEATATQGEIWAHTDPNRSAADVRGLAADGARADPQAREHAFALFDAWFRAAI